MKQTIEIDVPDGKKAVWKNGKVYFLDSTSQLPKTWEEFCNTHDRKEDEAYIESDSKIAILGKEHVDKRHPEEDSSLLPSKQVAEQHLALMKLHQLRDCYRQGWKPNRQDWTPNWNGGRAKYCITRQNSLLVTYYYEESHFLSFQTRELAEEFLNNFRDLIEQAGDLI